MNKIGLVLLGTICCFARLDGQDKWLIEDDKDPAFIVELSVTNGKLEAATRKAVLIDYLGMPKYNLIKTMYPVKYAEIIHFEARMKEGSDSFTGTYNKLYTEYRIEGRISAGRIEFSVFDKSANTKSNFTGKKLKRGLKPKSFISEVEKIIQAVDENLYDPAQLESKAWVNFKVQLRANAAKMQDELELQTAVFALGLELPFSHLSLVKKQPESSPAHFTLTEINDTTCLLLVPSFTGNRRNMEDMINRIASKAYAHLVIDLRNNPGGNNETALILGNFLARGPFVSGFFANKRWYSEFKRLPLKEDLPKFSSFTKGSLTDFYKQAATRYGTYIKNIPSKNTFRGKVYVIVNERTASTAEAFTLALKENKTAVVVGAKTAGQMLSAKSFPVNNHLLLMLPVNDYVSYAGYRIDKRGVQPDVIVKTDPFDYILKNMIKN